METIVYTDASSQPKKKRSVYGYLVVEKDKSFYDIKIDKYEKDTVLLELLAIEKALVELIEKGYKNLIIYCDNQSIVDTIDNIVTLKKVPKKLIDRVKSLLLSSKSKIYPVTRFMVSEIDKLIDEIQ